MINKLEPSYGCDDVLHKLVWHKRLLTAGQVSYRKKKGEREMKLKKKKNRIWKSISPIILKKKKSIDKHTRKGCIGYCFLIWYENFA